MKGFKNSTKTQSGHGDKIATVMHEYGAGKLHSGSKSGPLVKSPKQAVAIAISEQRKAPIKKADGGRISEESSRPLTAKELAAAKAMKINTPGKSVPVHKSAPKVTNGMILGESEDRAPGERGAKKFAVGGLVPPVASGGMPALSKPLTSTNVNDARVAPPRQRSSVVNPGIRGNGLPKAWADNYAADSARRLGVNPQPTARDLANRAADAARSTGTPPAPARPTSASMDPVTAAKLKMAQGYKKGGKVVEKGSKEVYASKAAMKKHEASESKAKERAEHKQEGGELLAGRAQSLRDMTGKPSGRPGYAKGGKSRWS